jgi:hypothetical protein
MNVANTKTYLLIRNGECLYRIWTSYETGANLIPKTDEFLRFFEQRRYNYQTNQDEIIALKPGSDAFMEAEKRAGAQKRHYMRAALILQGLIDRTTILHPLPGPINVGDAKSWDHDLAVILDGDAMLTDGRERFLTWLGESIANSPSDRASSGRSAQRVVCIGSVTSVANITSVSFRTSRPTPKRRLSIPSKSDAATILPSTLSVRTSGMITPVRRHAWLTEPTSLS